MTDLFRDPKRRLRRANEHIADLEAGTQTFLDGKPYARVIQVDSETGNKIHKVVLTQQFPDRLLDQAVEIAEGLRAVLDKTGFASAEALGNTRLKGTYFPIADTDSQIDTDIIGRGRCRDLHPDILALFRTFEPHKTGNPLIWGVNQLANGSKHRILEPVGLSIGNVFVETFRNSGITVQVEFPPIWDAANDEMILCIVGPDAEPQYKMKLQMFVALRHVEGLPRAPATAVFRAMAREIERVLVAAEAETARLVGGL